MISGKGAGALPRKAGVTITAVGGCTLPAAIAKSRCRNVVFAEKVLYCETNNRIYLFRQCTKTEYIAYVFVNMKIDYLERLFSKSQHDAFMEKLHLYI